MLRCTVKFCGGCNPKYERGDAYAAIRSALSDVAEFSLPRDGEQYDALLIITGCTACEYDYAEIAAAHRIRCTGSADVPAAIQALRQLC
ncbi:MAG: hypothetical protein ACI4PQ_03920 [Butyricicoccaceae bacterium]